MAWRESYEIPNVAHNAPIPMATRVGNILYTSGIMGKSMETGEFPTTRGQPCGKRTLTGRALMQWMEERLQRELEHAQPRPAPRAAAQPFQTGVAQ